MRYQLSVQFEFDPQNLRRRELITITRDHATAMPKHSVLRHWRAP